MKLVTRLTSMALAFFLVLCAEGIARQPASTAAATLPPPRFNAMAVLTRIASPPGRRAFRLGPHAYLASLRYGTASGVFPGSVGVRARHRPVWALTFLDPRAVADRRTTGRPSICPMTLIALSAVDGTRLARSCRASLPGNLATQPPPRFGVRGILKDLRCRCAADGPRPFSFGVGKHAYLAILRYGRIRDLFPRNSMGKAIQGLPIWDLVFLDPQVAVDKQHAGNHAASVCARNTVSLRAGNGSDEAWSCYPGG
jgi:hypothetical protein